MEIKDLEMTDGRFLFFFSCKLWLKVRDAIKKLELYEELEGVYFHAL